MKKAACLFLLLHVFVVSKSQNLTGTWEGSGSGAPYWRIGIIHIGDSCYGYSYDSGPGHCKANFVASFNMKDNKFKGRAISFIEKTFGHGLFTCNLYYEKEGSTEYLRGGVRPKSTIAQVFSLGIGMPSQLKKISNTIDTTLFTYEALQRLTKNIVDTIAALSVPIQNDTTNAVESITADSTMPKAFTDSVTAIKESRKTIVQQSIITVADTVKIILYDDGEIDGDIVTIFDNGKIVANKLSLTKQPYEIVITLPTGNSKHTIELMAENEGNIPPNTAYMLVLAGNERVEVKASSDKLSNAAIVIQKDKP